MKPKKPIHYILRIHSRSDPALVSIVFKSSPLQDVKDYGNKIWEMNPTAYYMAIYKEEEIIFEKKLL